MSLTDTDIKEVIAPSQPVHYVCNERFTYVLKMLEPYQAKGVEVTCDNCSVTLSKGAYAECFNVTTPDGHIRAAAHRVITS